VVAIEISACAAACVERDRKYRIQAYDNAFNAGFRAGGFSTERKFCFRGDHQQQTSKPYSMRVLVMRF
jgi:hypothetical protein